ncbi:hypothetical protein I3843_12G084600 [Carya illinoinensis]|nr:hypothetical protein I3760_12G082400 [Carya illinoinensis]KAG7952928.1 hypothetical protein I3843_12G084600 [Carya illinoinensis]
MKKIEEEKAATLWDCGSPLYDSYEIASLGHVLERHMMALPLFSGSNSAISPFTSSSDSGHAVKNEGLDEAGSVPNSEAGSHLKRRILEVEMKETAKKLRSWLFRVRCSVGLCKKKHAKLRLPAESEGLIAIHHKGLQTAHGRT